jgi:RHH-type proline utilization regulon transcriptional repressor/proline dehydrogenase/delta 1-pyrroline-5-carboxylate dehydrogenase
MPPYAAGCKPPFRTKPASDTVLVAWGLCNCFWDAGVPKEALQLLSCSGSRVGARLAADPRVDAVFFTGGTATALRMLEAKPDMTLMAETGGKNATIVTAMADRDQAIKHVLHSAFSHSGQKCSATSMLILEEEVYDDPAFKTALCDAVKSLPVGSAWDRKTRVGPLIRPPGPDLERGLKVLEPGERWAVLPKRLGHNPQLWSPGLKWDVRPGGFTHMTELFGPVLAVMKAKDLSEAIALVNQTGYGLTSGIETLDEREQRTWIEGIRSGNLYINRVTTGAVVLRQPFGGMGKSAFGSGIKAGGPNYVAQLMDFQNGELVSTDEDIADPLLVALKERVTEHRSEIPGLANGEADRLRMAIGSYARAMREEMAAEHDHFRLLGQDNIRRYLPVRDLCVRVHPADGFFDLLARLAAAQCAGCRVRLSIPPETPVTGLDWLSASSPDWTDVLEVVEEDDDALAAAIRAGCTERIRYAGPERVPLTICAAANETGIFVARAPVLAEGRVELLWYVREQSISRDYHRYGNLGERAAEERAPVL